MKRSKLNALLGVLLFALVAVFAVVAQSLKPGAVGVDGSAASIAPHGRRALYLLLEELGFRPEIWSRSPGLLPRGEHILWLAKRPDVWGGADRARSATTPETEENPDSPVAMPSALDRHSLAHYRRFVEEGGTLILPWSDETQRFLVDDLGVAEFASVEALSAEESDECAVRLSTGETCTVACRSAQRLTWPEEDSSLRPLWLAEGESAGEDEDVLALALPLGGGQVVVLGADAWFDNEKLRELDHALLGVRLVQELDRGGSVLFDEYALGLWTPETATGLAFSGRLFLLSANLVLLFVFFAWRRAWVSAYPRDPVAHEHVSALSRARVLAGLFERAGRYATLSRALRAGVVRSITGRFGGRFGMRRGRASVGEDGPTEWTALLRAQGAVDLDRWEAALAGGTPKDARELDLLERELRGLELRWKESARARILSR